MCVIAISKAGAPQPTSETLRTMFRRNPDGAGYMTARNGKVMIHKGFMAEDDYIRAVEAEHFTEADPVVYHCRISTQAGVNPWMTHPFPLTSDIVKTKLLDCEAPCGVAHNGIIRLTSDPKDHEYSDTAHFVSEYMPSLIRTSADLYKPAVLKMLRLLTDSRLAILDGASGHVATVGDWIEDGGVLYSNGTYKPYVPPVYGTGSNFSYRQASLYGSSYTDWWKKVAEADEDELEYDSDTDTWVPAQRGKPLIIKKRKNKKRA